MLTVVLGGTILNSNTISGINFTASGYANLQYSGISISNVSPISIHPLQSENERLRQQLQEEKIRHDKEITERDRRIALLEQIVFPNLTTGAESRFSCLIPIRGFQQQLSQA
jgi:hypothetical protein